MSNGVVAVLSDPELEQQAAGEDACESRRRLAAAMGLAAGGARALSKEEIRKAGEAFAAQDGQSRRLAGSEHPMFSLYSFFGGVTHANIAASEANRGARADAGCGGVRARAPQIAMPAMFKMESGETWYMGADQTTGEPLLRFDRPHAGTLTDVQVVRGAASYTYKMYNFDQMLEVRFGE